MVEKELSLIVWENGSDDRVINAGINSPKFRINVAEDGSHFVYSYRLRRLLFDRWVKVVRPSGLVRYKVERLFDSIMFEKQAYTIGDRVSDTICETYKIDVKMSIPDVPEMLDALNSISRPDGDIGIPVREFHIETDAEIALWNELFKPMVEIKEEE
jgi:hypothetical protein